MKSTTGRAEAAAAAASFVARECVESVARVVGMTHQNSSPDGAATTTILTFNVFMGSPIPSCCCGTRALGGSRRQKAQIAALRALDADVMCLQEVADSSLITAYEMGLGGEYASVWSAAVPGWRARVGAEAMFLAAAATFALLLYVMLAVIPGSAHISESPGPAIATLAVYGFARRELPHTALGTFLLGDVAGCLVTLYRVRKFSLEVFETVRLRNQEGDFMNMYRPRCVQFVALKARARDVRYVLTHVHVNALGATEARGPQLAECAAYAVATEDLASTVVMLGDFNAPRDAPELAALHSTYHLVDTLAERGAAFRDRPTWTAANPLTRGWMRHPDHRPDHILVRKTAIDGGASSRVVLDTAPHTSDHFGVLLTLEDRSLSA